MHADEDRLPASRDDVQSSLPMASSARFLASRGRHRGAPRRRFLATCVSGQPSRWTRRPSETNLVPLLQTRFGRPSLTRPDRPHPPTPSPAPLRCVERGSRKRTSFSLPLSTWPFITFHSADLPSETPSSFNLSKPLRADLTPPTPLSSYAATPLVERGEPEENELLPPPSPRSIAKQCVAGEGGRGGEVGPGGEVGRAMRFGSFGGRDFDPEPTSKVAFGKPDGLIRRVTFGERGAHGWGKRFRGPVTRQALRLEADRE